MMRESILQKPAVLREKKATSFVGFFCFLFFSVLLFSLGTSTASAYRKIQTNTELTGDFVLSPAKIEIDIDPGSTATRTIAITNRVNKTVDFSVNIEDFRGSQSSEQTVVLLGGENGPYSLKDFITPEINEFSLKPGEKIMLPVSITLPPNAEPGGLYGSVLVKNQIAGEGEGTRVVSRLGSLLFVKVAGEATEEGSLQAFRLAQGNKPFYTSGPFDFEFVYENTGNVHTIPYGRITVYNTIGNPVNEIEIEPYFALPDSLRYRSIHWNKEVLFGRYTAVIELNRGYDDIIDTKKIVFWVLPWKWIAGSFSALFVILLLGYFFITKLEIRVKKK